MYICPGCCNTSKKSWGYRCKQCDYEVAEKSFPTVESLIKGIYKVEGGDWNHVNLPLFTKTLIEKAIELNLIKFTKDANSKGV